MNTKHYFLECLSRLDITPDKITTIGNLLNVCLENTYEPPICKSELFSHEPVDTSGLSYETIRNHVYNAIDTSGVCRKTYTDDYWHGKDAFVAVLRYALPEGTEIYTTDHPADRQDSINRDLFGYKPFNEDGTQTRRDQVQIILPDGREMFGMLTTYITDSYYDLTFSFIPQTISKLRG